MNLELLYITTLIKYKLSQNMQNSSINTEEINKFSALAEEWWKPDGKFKTLHKFNPSRLEFIIKLIKKNFFIDKHQVLPLKGLSILDIGCGGGLLCEPLSRLGASITGLDAVEKNIKAAAIHAKKNNLDIKYIHSTVEDLDIDKKFDVILNMEVVEHVNNQQDFIKRSCDITNKNGLIFVATLNKTLFSLIFAKFTAEYVLNMLPKGTHDWHKFLTPEQIYAFLIQNSFEVLDTIGISFNPINNSWNISKSTKGNYIVAAKKN